MTNLNFSSNALGETWDILSPDGAEAYCKAAHARADSLEREISETERSYPALLARRVAMMPDMPLVTIGDLTLTAVQLQDQAARLGGTLSQTGVGKDDKVAILCGNRIEFPTIVAAISWIGAVSVPINTASRGLQLQHILSSSGAKVLIVEGSLLDALTTIDRAELPLEKIYVLDGTGETLPEGIEGLPDVGDPVPYAEVRPSDACSILYTSGTTGLSKGVICPHGQFFWWAITTGRQLGVSQGDVLHTTLPLFHTNALNCFFQALVFGATQSLDARFSVSQFYERLKASDATVTYLLGAMVPMLLSRPSSPAERDHKTRVALAPGVPAHFQAVFTERTGILLLDAFGSTETNNVIQTEANCVNPGSMGWVTRGFDARVVDFYDYEVPDGTPGELLLRADAPYAFASGYLGMPEATVETWRNLWVHTGDRVVRSEDGSYRFIDRIKETIRRRGENISSFEVELGVLSHPAVGTASAYPVASELAEDEVMVAIVLKEGMTLDFEELIHHCAPQMPYFAVPRYIDIRSDLPRTESGKIQKFKLREEGITDTTWDREAAGVVVKR
jgi:carnitine-CoA ligase